MQIVRTFVANCSRFGSLQTFLCWVMKLLGILIRIKSRRLSGICLQREERFSILIYKEQKAAGLYGDRRGLKMDLGFTGKTGAYYLQALVGGSAAAKNKAEASNRNADFWEMAIARSKRAAEQERRQFAIEQRNKKLRRAYYARINEESAIKRKLQEMENNRMYYQESVRALPISSVYQKRVRQAMASIIH